MLAKICSDLHKPDGQFLLENDRKSVMDFVETLPVRKVCSIRWMTNERFFQVQCSRLNPPSVAIQIPGVGRVTEQLLGALGVDVCGDILRKLGLISALMTPSLVDFTLSAGLGLGQTRHSLPTPEGEPGRKGISCERSFKPMTSTQELEAMVGPWVWQYAIPISYRLLSPTSLIPSSSILVSLQPPHLVTHLCTSQASTLVTHLCEDMAAEGLEGRTITLKLKLTTFELRTRAATLPAYASQPDRLLPAILR